jgi:hypothetical protein
LQEKKIEMAKKEKKEKFTEKYKLKMKEELLKDADVFGIFLFYPYPSVRFEC